MKLLTAILFVIFLFGQQVFADSDHELSGHDHSKKTTEGQHDKDDSHKHEDEAHDHKEDKSHKHDEKSEEGHGHNEDGHGHGEHESAKFGKGKAILEVKNDGRYFRLAETAIKTLGLKSVKIKSNGGGSFEVPSSSVVDFQDEIGIFKRKGDWFELVEIKIVERGKFAAKVTAKELSSGDEIVNEGVALLRVAHLEATGQGGQGHVH